MNKKICPKCQKENKGDANFCAYCGTKIEKECNCWVKGQLYNCGFDKCPGHKLPFEGKRVNVLEGSIQAHPAKFIPEDSNKKYYEESEKCNFN